MGSLAGNFQRPLVAAAAVAAASLSAEFSERFPSLRSLNSTPESVHQNAALKVVEVEKLSWVSLVSVSKLADLSFATKTQVYIPNLRAPAFCPRYDLAPSMLCASVVPSPVLHGLYQSAEWPKASRPTTVTSRTHTAVPDISYRWHLPQPSAINSSAYSDCTYEKSRTVVVLLGWLGSKQKHLNRYAEWYASRGFHVITFTLPMNEILSYQAGGKAEQNIESLVNHLADCLKEEHGENLVFHTFSNTGWLVYGAILEKFQQLDQSLMSRIKGCIVDSAPVASPDPQVWASGFSAAFLKKRSVATKGFTSLNKSGEDVLVGNTAIAEPKPALTETALLLVLEKFFKVVLNLPTVNRRLSDVLNVLSSGQPKCPQLYIYSSADRVIPSNQVESYINEQRKAGKEVRSCNFLSTPHVDHYRNDPKLYTSQLSLFLEDCVLTTCKDS